MKRKVDHIDLNKHLTQQELLDYKRGVLGNEEMYRLELHLNECELCSDALEGIDQIKYPEDILRSINDTILPKKQESTISPNRYLAIAASVLLVAAIGFTFWMLNPTDSDKSLAVNTTEKEKKDVAKREAEQEQVESIASQTDSTSFTQDETAVSEQDTKFGANNMEQKPVAAPPTEQPAKSETPEVAKNKLAMDKAQAGKEADELQEQVTEEEGFADRTAALTVTDTSGNQGNGLAVPTAAQDEMVASQTMRAKKADTRNAPESVADRKEPEPVGGMSSYKTYLDNNVAYPQEAIDNKIKGTVVLDVTINPNGTIKTITVVKGLGYGCDDEARRLVMEGPKWLPAAENGHTMEATQQIKVRFKL